MRRVSVVGSSGSGKTTASRAIEERCALPRLELDSVYHQPDWNPLADDEFKSIVEGFVSQETWIVDGNYTSAGVLDLVWQRADTVVWLDPPRAVVMWRVVSRTLSRGARGTELWNGNRESLKNILKWDPEENIIRWAWTRFDHTRSKYEMRMEDPAWSHITFIRLRSRSDLREFLRDLT